MVNTKNMKLWIKELRSGSYKQCRGTLKLKDDMKGTGYCCLGVAVRAWEKDTGKKFNWKMRPQAWPLPNENRMESRGSYLPLVVRQWLGLKSYNPVLIDHRLKATEANDDRQYGFKKIATLLEQKYLGF